MDGQMSNMMNDMGQAQQQAMQQPQQQMLQNEQLTTRTYVWKQGMANWDLAGNVQELATLFGEMPPPMPPTQQMP